MENTETKSNYTEIESNFDINDDKEDEDKKDKESEDKEDKKDDFTLRMQELEKVLNQNKKKLFTYDYLRHHSIHEFFINLKKESMTHKDTALNVAKKIYNEGPWKARIIRKWAKNWIENGSLPVNLQGCHQKIKSFIDDEDVIRKSLKFIHTNKGKIMLKLYKTFIEETLFSQIGVYKSISEKTARI